MAKIIKSAEERRIELLETAQRLFFTEGYETTTIEKIIQEVGIAKGTFYHYFKSKDDLLGQLAEWRSLLLFENLKEQLKSFKGNALDKFRFLITSMAVWKGQQKEMVITFLNVLYRDENIPLRHKIFQHVISALAGLFAQVFKQGVEEGIFDIEDPEETSELILSLWMARMELFVTLILEMQEDKEKRDLFMAKGQALDHAFERILGVKKGTLKIYTPEVMDLFFKQ